MRERGRKLWGAGRVVRGAAVVVMWLVVGTVVSVLVAWGTCVHVPIATLRLKAVESVPMTQWPYPYGERWGRPDCVSRSVFWHATHEFAMWDLLRLDASFAPRRTAAADLVGVPFRGLRMGYESDPATVTTYGPVKFHTWSFDTRWLAGRLPLRPIMPGFVVNSVFYAVIACGLWNGLVAARRWRRVRRNQCAACGYSRVGLAEGSACPECGRGSL